MVKLFFFIKRKEGMSLEDFHRHWREEHSKLVTEHTGQYLLRYEQNHRLPADYERGEPEFDGVAVEWFASKDDFYAMATDPAYREHLYPDELSFLDHKGSRWILTEEPDVFVDKVSG